MLSIFSLSYAVTVTIGNGTNTARPPFNVLYGYGRSLGLYTANQIGRSGQIDKLSWYVSTPDTVTVPYKIYAKLTTATTQSSIYWANFTNGATVIKEGSHSFSSTGWHTFTLDTPFEYTGVNLLIGVETNHPTGTNYPGGSRTTAWFPYTNTGVNTHQWWDQSSQPPAFRGTLEDKLPNLQIEFAGPMLSLNPTEHDFGLLQLNATASQTFTIRNIGSEPLTVTGIGPTSSNCFTLTNAPALPVTLNYGQTVTFTIQYTPTDFGEHEGTFYINHDGRTTTEFTVRGCCQDPTLPVTLSHFSATQNAQNYVLLTWISQSENNLLGYHIYRNDSMELDSALQISKMIAGTNTSEPHTYTFYDEELTEAGTYYYWLQSVDLDGTIGYFGPISVVYSTGGGEGGSPGIPNLTQLENAYPNPFNPDTTIRYQLKDPGKVEIVIYNLKGQMLRSFSASHETAGSYHFRWDGRDSSGNVLPSGVYLYRMSSGKYNCTKKMVLQK